MLIFAASLVEAKINMGNLSVQGMGFSLVMRKPAGERQNAPVCKKLLHPVLNSAKV
jgi:hypothetical protein